MEILSCIICVDPKCNLRIFKEGGKKSQQHSIQRCHSGNIVLDWYVEGVMS